MNVALGTKATPMLYRYIVCVLLLIFVLPFVQAHAGHTGGDAELSYDSFYPSEGNRSVMNIMLMNWTTGFSTPLEVTHERLMHVFIVGADMESFWHIHPEDFPELTTQFPGVYRVSALFPKAGKYLMAVDYTSNSLSHMQLFNITVEGENEGAFTNVDFSDQQIVGNYTIKFDAPETIRANEPIIFTYRLQKDEMPITNLQQYLGSEMHVFVAHPGLDSAGHTHAYIPGHAVHMNNMTQRYSGPTIPIKYTFPGPGTYVLFGQFKHEDRVITTRFLVMVGPADTQAPIETRSLYRRVIKYLSSLFNL